MTSLADLRNQFPQYANVSDGDFLLGLNRKFYPDMHPRLFLNAIEGGANAHATIRNPGVKKWYRSNVSKPLPGEDQSATDTRLLGSAGGDPNVGGRFGAGARSALQGMTFGYGDELVGHGAALLSGNTPEYEIARERQRLAAGEEAYPVQSLTTEIGGSIAAPGAAVKSMAGAIGAGTAGGMLYASGKTEEGNRVEDAVQALPASLFFSALAVPAQRLGSKALKRVFGQAGKRPTVGTLRAAKNAAYKEVESSGFRFSADQLDDVLGKVYKDLDAPNSGYVVGDTSTERALRLIEKNWGEAKTLAEVDRLRSRLMKRWVNAGKEEAGSIMDMVQRIDEMIDGAAGANELLHPAREAYKSFNRVDFLEKAFQKAADQTAVTGSGGNIYNNYAKVFARILNNEKQARMFTPEMQAFMRRAIEATPSEEVMRKIGKLSPDGNGLMLSLNIIGGTIDPKLFAAGGVGAWAKRTADASMAGKVDDVLALAAGVRPVTPARTPTQLPYAASVAGQENVERRR